MLVIKRTVNDIVSGSGNLKNLQTISKDVSIKKCAYQS